MAMNFNNKDIYNLPNLISCTRLFLSPVLFLLAFNQYPLIFIAVLIFSEFTDVLDGFLARRLNQITELGSRLDSWGDFTIYSTISVCAWILWPDIVRRELFYFTTIILCFTLPVVVGLLKFRMLISYHTWSVKLAVAVTVLAYILLFSELLDWPFRAAMVVCLWAALEEVAITLIMPRYHVDVRSVLQALEYRRGYRS